MKAYFESLLQRSNSVKNYLEKEVLAQEPDILNWKESDKKWSVLEVVSHLNQVYEIYFPNFEKALVELKPIADDQENKPQKTILGRLSIYSMKPKGKKRRFKMKTFDFFEPASDATIPDKTLDRYRSNKENFNQLIIRCRNLDLKDVKVVTSLGEKVKFYVPECLEFLLAHEERHIVQIETTLQKALSQL